MAEEGEIKVFKIYSGRHRFLQRGQGRVDGPRRGCGDRSVTDCSRVILVGQLWVSGQSAAPSNSRISWAARETINGRDSDVLSRSGGHHRRCRGRADAVDDSERRIAILSLTALRGLEGVDDLVDGTSLIILSYSVLDGIGPAWIWQNAGVRWAANWFGTFLRSHLLTFPDHPDPSE